MKELSILEVSEVSGGGFRADIVEAAVNAFNDRAVFGSAVGGVVGGTIGGVAGWTIFSPGAGALGMLAGAACGVYFGAQVYADPNWPQNVYEPLKSVWHPNH